MAKKTPNGLRNADLRARRLRVKNGALAEGDLPGESNLRSLSAAVVLKQIFLTADLTVKNLGSSNASLLSFQWLAYAGDDLVGATFPSHCL